MKLKEHRRAFMTDMQKLFYELIEELQKVSESSLDFWDNDIDDEVWNNI